MIGRKVMEQLLNLINISFFKLFSSPDDTVTKVGWLFISQEIKNASNKWKCVDLKVNLPLDGCKRLISRQFSSFCNEVFRILKILKCRSSIGSENSFEFISSPLIRFYLWCLWYLYLQTCKQCSIAFGKFFKVQIGIDFSGGSRDEPYDSVTPGITTWVLPIVPSVPDSRSGSL